MHLLQALEKLEERGWSHHGYTGPNGEVCIAEAISKTWMELHGYTASSEFRYVRRVIRQLD